MIQRLIAPVNISMGTISNDTVLFNSETRRAFLIYVSNNPSSRRISRTESNIIIGWLVDPSKRPSSQKEFSRRNYVRKTFIWKEDTRNLLAADKVQGDKYRIVVTEDAIADVIESIHQQNGHLGWDATWRDVSTSYHGVLRSNVIFLLKRCDVYSQHPSKRPKGSTNSVIIDTSGIRGISSDSKTKEPVYEDDPSPKSCTSTT